MYYNNTLRAMKRLSIKPEDGEATNDEDGNISDYSTTSTASYSSYSSIPGSSPKQRRQFRTPSSLRYHHNYNNKPHPLKHAQSVDNLYSSSPPHHYQHQSPPQERRILDQNYIFGSTMRRSSRRSSSKYLTKMRSCENLLSSSPQDGSGISALSSLGSPQSRRASSKGGSSTNLMAMRSNLMTSSYRNLADRNVRENPAFQEPPKVITLIPYLQIFIISLLKIE